MKLNKIIISHKLRLFVVALAVIFAIGCTGVSRQDYLNGNFGTVDKTPPELLAPANNSKVTNIKNSQVTLVWTSKVGALKYTLEIVKDDGSTDPFVNSDNNLVDGNPFTINAPVASQKVTLPDAWSYRWRVRANITEADKYGEGILHAFNDAVYVYCPASVTTCSEDTDGDGKDDTIGNKSKPFRTVQKSITQAAALKLKTLVAKRDISNLPYNESAVFAPGTMLLGGYDSATWIKSANDRTKIASNKNQIISIIGITENNTRIEAFEIISNSSASLNYVVYSANNDNRVVIDDCVINASNSTTGGTSYAIYNSSASTNISNNIINGGSGGGESYGIYNINSYSPIITNNTIYAGSGDSSYAIYNTNSSPLITGNNINGGDGADYSHGIYNYDTSISNASSPKISGNTISGGRAGDTSYGIRNYNTSPSISKNIIYGGSGDTSYGVYNVLASPAILNNTIQSGGANISRSIHSSSSSSPYISGNTIISGSGTTSSGIYNSNLSSPNISNNTISGGSGGSSYGVRNNNSSSPGIENNILFNSSTSTSYGIYEDTSGSSPSTFKNNLIFSTPNGLYYDNGSTSLFDNDCSTKTINFATTVACGGGTLQNPTGGAGAGSGNITLTTTPSQSIVDVFAYNPSEIVYTAISVDGTTAEYQGNSTTIEVQVDSGNSINDCTKFTMGQYFEYFYDNVVRTIQSISCGGSNENTVTFTPALTYDFGQGIPILLWGTANTNYEKKYALKTGSPSLLGGLTCPTDYSSKIHTWGSGNDQANCDMKFPYANSTYNVGNCETTYLHPVMEIFNDNIGNDNGLCEQGETCLHNPNMGNYAGHASTGSATGLIASSCDVSGIISGITLMKYENNGY